jgi:hypothetical protein
MPAGVESRERRAGRSATWPALSAACWFALALLSLGGGCQPQVSVGDWPCGSAPLVVVDGAGGEAPATTLPIGVPWSTSFEDGFCGYTAARGFCYGDADDSYKFSSEHAHSGRIAAAFRVSTQGAEQSRCVREGILPDEAYYGAWFWVPAATVSKNWNLMHFQGFRNDQLQGLWDVSLGSTDDGRLYLYVFDFFRMKAQKRSAPLEVTPGAWFHVVFFLRRAADASGEVALLQDGEEVVRLSDITTDDSTWGQWYVGNLVGSITPPDATVYVDDVTIDTHP